MPDPSSFNVKSLELMFDYTKFHIGAYLTIVTGDDAFRHALRRPMQESSLNVRGHYTAVDLPRGPSVVTSRLATDPATLRPRGQTYE